MVQIELVGSLLQLFCFGFLWLEVLVYSTSGSMIAVFWKHFHLCTYIGILKGEGEMVGPLLEGSCLVSLVNFFYVFWFIDFISHLWYINITYKLMTLDSDTGTEALFADLAHFPVSAVQLAFTVVVFPCLLLAYSGQAAYLVKNQDHVVDAFYRSIPGLLWYLVFGVQGWGILFEPWCPC